MATPKQIADQLGPPWVYVPKTRSIRNTQTGQRISRRQLEVTQGRLAEEGFRGFEEKAQRRRQLGLRGFRTVRRDVHERVIDIRERRQLKSIVRNLPAGAGIQITVYGDVLDDYNTGVVRDWRTVNFFPRYGPAVQAYQRDIMEVWDNRFSKAQARVVRNPTRWMVRVYYRQ